MTVSKKIKRRLFSILTVGQNSPIKRFDADYQAETTILPFDGRYMFQMTHSTMGRIVGCEADESANFLHAR